MEAQTGDRLRAAARRLNRVRWASKTSVVRGARPGGTAGTVDKLRYVLWSPELGDHSFDIADSADLAGFVADALSLPADAIARGLAEAEADEQLRADYAALRNPLLLPARLALSQRALWWALVRACRPKLVVETGIRYGLGSAVLLRALELNGGEGELVSCDPDTTGGWLVPERLRPSWNWVQACSGDGLEDALEGRQVDLFIHDVTADHEIERSDFELALRHAAPGCILLSANGDCTSALPELCADHGLVYRHTSYQPRRHFYVSTGVGMARVSAALASAGSSSEAPNPITPTPTSTSSAAT